MRMRRQKTKDLFRVGLVYESDTRLCKLGYLQRPEMELQAMSQTPNCQDMFSGSLNWMKKPGWFRTIDREGTSKHLKS